MPKVTTDMVVASYVETRNKIKDLEAQISELKAFQAKKEEWLLTKLDADNETGIKTKHGTVFTTVFESVTVAESEAFFNWVKENDRFDCLEKRAAKAEILHIMGDREDAGRPNPPPPGLNYVAIRKVGIRKA